MMPLGTYINTMRNGGFDSSARANAGIIASKKGSAIAVPAPLKNVLRGM
jgi:hypothetical protein